MDFSFQFLQYLLFSIIIIYSIAAIPKRGIKALLAAILAFIILKNEVGIFDLDAFLSSIIIGLSIAIIYYYFEKKYHKIYIPEENQSSNTKQKKILHAVIAISILGAVLSFFYSALNPLNSNAFLLLILSIFIPYFLISFFMSAKQIYHKEYVYIGAAKQIDEEKIKIILKTNSIPHITEPLFKDPAKNSSKNMIKVLIKEGLEDRAMELLKDTIDSSPILKWY